MFARHCALLSCVPTEKRSSITLKGLSIVINHIRDYVDNTLKPNTDDHNSGKLLYDLYISNLDVICHGIEVGGKPLIRSVVPNDFSYEPKKFVTVVRGKYKNGIWKMGEDYKSNMLYRVFRDICVDKLNIIY